MDLTVPTPMPFDTSDADAVEAVVALYRECHTHALPGTPGMPDLFRRVEIAEGSPGRASDIEVIRDRDRIVAFLRLDRLLNDNEHVALVTVLVHPEYRRRGFGSVLLDRALSLAADDSRTEILGRVEFLIGQEEDAAAGRRLLESRGFALSQAESYRYVEVNAIDPEVEAELYAQARARSEGYELVQWTGEVPQKQMELLLHLDRMTLAEVPTGETSIGAETFGIERAVEWQEVRTKAGIDAVQTVVRDPESGRYVGNTVMYVYAAPAVHAIQSVTLVDPAHRGKGLGMLLKLANLRLLRETYPRVELIETFTANTNTGMNAINEKLGFTARYRSEEYLKRL